MTRGIIFFFFFLHGVQSGCVVSCELWVADYLDVVWSNRVYIGGGV